MREFVIKSLDVLVWVVAGIIVLFGVVLGLLLISQGQAQGIVLIVLAPIYAIIFAGWIFLSIGTYNNTRRTAEALEKLASR